MAPKNAEVEKYRISARYQYLAKRFPFMTGVLVVLGPPTYAFLVALALWYDDQYGMATLTIVSLMAAWAVKAWGESKSKE